VVARALLPLRRKPTRLLMCGLSSFNNANPNGTWQLFVADLSHGYDSQLVSWGMNITVAPEPAPWMLGMMGGLILVAGLKWKRK
jgi:hypothetical protein